MKERARELKAAAGRAENEAAVLATIAARPEADRRPAERLHAVITAAAPALAPRLDSGAMWTTSYALTHDLTTKDENAIAARVKRAVG